MDGVKVKAPTRRSGLLHWWDVTGSQVWFMTGSSCSSGKGEKHWSKIILGRGMSI